MAAPRMRSVRVALLSLRDSAARVQYGMAWDLAKGREACETLISISGRAERRWWRVTIDVAAGA